MKKYFFTLLLALLTFKCFAQNYVTRSDYTKPSFGIKGGLNLATEYNGVHESGARIGLHAGILGEFFCTPKFGLQPELIFSMQGARYKDDNIRYTDKINYINLPVLLKIYVERDRRLSVDTGLQGGYMISFKLKENGGGEQDLYEYVDNKFDASILLGMSYKFRVIEFSLRYNVGLLNPVKGLKTKNSVVQFSAAIMI